MKEISKQRNLSLVTIENHILQSAEEDVDFNWIDVLPEEIDQQINDVINRVGAEKLKPIKEELPNHISYFMIKASILKSKIKK
jgi:ATP-dependent DNA helicase RecQ